LSAEALAKADARSRNLIPKQTSNAQPAFASYGAAGAKRPTPNLKKARDLIRSLQTRCRYGRYGRGENLRQRM